MTANVCLHTLHTWTSPCGGTRAFLSRWAHTWSHLHRQPLYNLVLFRSPGAVVWKHPSAHTLGWGRGLPRVACAWRTGRGGKKKVNGRLTYHFKKCMQLLRGTTARRLVEMNNPIIETIWLKLQPVKGPPITDLREKSKHLFRGSMVIAIKKAVILVNSHFAKVGLGAIGVQDIIRNKHFPITLGASPSASFFLSLVKIKIKVPQIYSTPLTHISLFFPPSPTILTAVTVNFLFTNINMVRVKIWSQHKTNEYSLSKS